MFKLIALSTLLAIAAARPGLVGTDVVAPYAQLATPLAYSGQLNPIGYAGVAAPVALPDPLVLPGPIAYSSPVAVAAPVAVTSHVAASSPVIEPVAPVADGAAPLLKTASPVPAPVVAAGPIEQHGYKIVY